MNARNNSHNGLFIGLFLLVMLLTTGCNAPYRLVPPGKVNFDDYNVSVETTIPWNECNFDFVRTWTQDGPDLENILFHLGIEDGAALISGFGDDSKVKMPPPLTAFSLPMTLVEIRLPITLSGKAPDEEPFLYRKAMTGRQIMDLFAASFSKITHTPILATDLRSTTLDNHPGFRFDYSFTGTDGVHRKGLAIGAVVDTKLYLLHYYGAESYYYERYRADAEKVIVSFRFGKGTGH